MPTGKGPPVMTRVMIRQAALAFLLSVLCAGAPAAEQGDPAAAGPAEVSFHLNRDRARPGKTATLVLAVRTNVPLRALSVAIDFDESKVRIQDFRRLPPLNEDGDPTGAVPEDIESSSMNNSDVDSGNQVGEGWFHIDLNAVGDRARLLTASVREVPVLEITFLVLPDAAFGFTPVVFETVGPVNVAPMVYFVNRVEPAFEDAPAPGAKGLDPNQLIAGGIQIIGEVGFFMRGDTNFDRQRDITDPIVTLGYLFSGGVQMSCADAADANDDGELDLSDAIFTLGRLFERAEPFPEPERWGLDPTEDELGCSVYPGL